MKFSNKKHRQMRKGLRVVCMPASEMLVFNKTDHLPDILVVEGLACSDVDDGKLDATNIGTRLCDFVHAINFSNSLDERWNFLVVAFSNCKTLLVLLFFDFLLRCSDQNLVQLWGVVERIDGGRFINWSKFQILTLLAFRWPLVNLGGKTHRDMSLFRGLPSSSSSFGSVEKIVLNKFASFVTWTETECSSRFWYSWVKVVREMDLMVPLSQVVVFFVVYMRQTMLFCN